MSFREEKERVGKVSIKTLSWPPESSFRIGQGLALKPSLGMRELLMPEKAPGRVASMPRLKSSHESIDLEPHGWVRLVPIPYSCAQGD